MKKNFKRGIAFFLVGLLVMQVFFTGGSKKASAAHSDKASILFLGGMKLTAATTAADTSLPAPYNTKFITNYMVKTIKDSSKSTYDLSYCIDYDKLVSTGQSLSSTEQDAGSLLTTDQARLINYAIMLGYNRQTMDINNKSQDETLQYFATQALIWIIQDNFYYDTTNRPKLEQMFFTRWPGIKTYYQNLSAAVEEQMRKPSFVDGQTYTMCWNEAKNIFGITFTNTTANAMKNVYVDTSSLPAGVTTSIEGEQLIIHSQNEITTPFKVKLVKNLGKKGRVVAWKTTGADKQPQATIDYDLDPIAQEFEVIVKTPTKPVPTVPPTQTPTCPPTETPTVPPTEVPTCPPTQEVTVPPTEVPTCPPTEVPTCPPTAEVPTCPPTEEPTCPPVVTPEEPPVKEEPKDEFETIEKEVVIDDGLTNDDSPKTADESNITLVYIMLGASLITMVGLISMNAIDKKRYR